MFSRTERAIKSTDRRRSSARCTVSRITERKKALEIRATKRLSVNIVGKMPFCVLEVEKLF